MTYTTLISAQALRAHGQDPDWVIVDCRHDLMNPLAGEMAYREGHLPRAYFAHLDTMLSGEKLDAAGVFKGRHPFPDRTALIQTLRAWGVHESTQLIAYDAQSGMFAARLWALLRWLGHARVAVLDGGLPAWLASGGELVKDIPEVAQGTIVAKPALLATVEANTVLENIQHPVFTLVDARAPDRFRGENETIDPHGGHIPGAKNRFFKDNLQADGCFKPAEQLREAWLGILPDPAKAVMQCGSGVTACHNLLALEIAGLGGGALYPGSWSEWCADEGRPIAKGNE